MLEFRVRDFTKAGNEFRVCVPESATFQDVKAQVRQANGLPEFAYVRVLCAGQEMASQEPVTKATSAVLLVVTSLTPPTPCPPSPERARPQVPPLQQLQQQQQQHQVQRGTTDTAAAAPAQAPVQPPPTDWLDIVDPGTLLMWIFGLIIAVLWLLLLFNSRMFDSTSVIILFIMTVAFLLPVVLSFLPFPTFLTPHIQPWNFRGTNRTRAHAGAPSTQPPSRYTIIDGEYIPPRPPARIRPHQS